MIVKKIPILQGFPDFDTVKKLSKIHEKKDVSSPVFYDIETTGLSRYSTFLYLIGAVTCEKEQWVLTQWMAENPQEEPLILKEFYDFMQNCSCTVQYNGNRFDQPYLEERYRINGLASPFHGIPSLDLYQELKICQSLLGLSRMKQPDLEAFLKTDKRRYCDGGQCVHLYKMYSKNRDSKLADTVLGHNFEDLMGLGSIITMLGYTALFYGAYKPENAEFHESSLLFTARLPSALPENISCGNDLFQLTAGCRELKLRIPVKEGRIRQYYENYKDYDYLPEEDMAISHFLSRYMDKSLRIPATRETCYTWIACSGEFLADKEKQAQYLRHSLPCFLKQIK